MGSYATSVDTVDTCWYVDVLAGENRWERFTEVARPDGAFELGWSRISDTNSTIE